MLSSSVRKTVIRGSRENASDLNQTHILLKTAEYSEYFPRRNLIVETRDLIVSVKQTQKVHHVSRWEGLRVHTAKPGEFSSLLARFPLMGSPGDTGPFLHQRLALRLGAESERGRYDCRLRSRRRPGPNPSWTTQNLPKFGQFMSPLCNSISSSIKEASSIVHGINS